jgi:hypothetical protein
VAHFEKQVHFIELKRFVGVPKGRYFAPYLFCLSHYQFQARSSERYEGVSFGKPSAEVAPIFSTNHTVRENI